MSDGTDLIMEVWCDVFGHHTNENGDWCLRCESYLTEGRNGS